MIRAKHIDREIMSILKQAASSVPVLEILCSLIYPQQHFTNSALNT